MHQEADLRGQRHRERRRHAPECRAAQRACAGSRRRRSWRGVGAACAATAGRPIHSAIAGSSTTAITSGRSEHGVGESVVRDRQHQHRRDQDAAGACAVERQAERKPALAVEPQPDHVADGADVHRRRAHRHQQVDEIELPKRVDDGEQRDRAAEAARADQHHAPRAEPGDGVADENHQRRGEQIEAGDGGGDRARSASRAAGAARSDRRRGRKGRSPSRTPPRDSRRTPRASRRSAARSRPLGSQRRGRKPRWRASERPARPLYSGA